MRLGTSALLGAPAGQSVAPADLAETQAVVRDAAARGAALAFLGGGTELGLGNPAERVDAVVRTERLERIVEYAPSDMTITVEAGITLGALQRTLAPERQRLALDPPLPELATVGGLIATNGYGPRRARYGTLRDAIVGISFVRADGRHVRGGGKVVKNVAGFDLPKLLVGSLGTLGLIATATLRLHPLPERERWLNVVVPSAKDVRELRNALLEAQLEPAALVVLRVGAMYDFCVLFEGFGAGVDEQSEVFARLALRRGLGTAEAPQGTVPRLDESGRCYGTTRLRLALAPAQLEALESEALVPLEAAFADCRIVLYPSLAVAFVCGYPGDPGPFRETLLAARSALEARGGSLVVLDTDEAALAGIDRFGSKPHSFFLMERLKARFDPERRLNRGRFIGGL